ncbi:MAG: glycosyltransferase family 2 protein [Gemmatimonadota bacterium]
MRVNDPELWRWRRAAPVRRADRVMLAVLVLAGLLLTVRFADWWFRPAHVANTALYVLLSLAMWYGVSRVVLGWINLLAIAAPEFVPAPAGLRVAIFTTSSPGEPLAMFEKTLAACARVRYPHTTYLLDDTRDPRFRAVAERCGAVWLELVGRPGAKAGKINAALRETTEDFILVLDPDHIPFPEMLDRVLGHFQDAKTGFVQVAQAYYNQTQSFAARAAAEQTYTFYGPTQMGLFGHHSAVAIGANCTFRRAALESIGGHGIGLAEDLVTSIRLHAAGWHSIYVPEVVSRGLVPEDLGSFYKQQLKWSRGVYEVLFSEVPHQFGSLNWRQRLSYLTIGTYYAFGVTTAMYLAIPYVFLWTRVQPAAMNIAEFVSHGGPVALLGIAVYLYSQRWLADRLSEAGTHWRALLLKVACWPVFLSGTVLGILRAEIPYIPTAKEAHRGRVLRLAWPQLTLLALYLLTVAWTIYQRLWRTPEAEVVLSSEAVWGMVGFATFALLMHAGAFYGAWEATHPPSGNAWNDVDITRIGGEREA